MINIKNYIHPCDEQDYSEILYKDITYIINVEREHYYDVYDINLYMLNNHHGDEVTFFSKMRDGHIAYSGNATGYPSGIIINTNKKTAEEIEKHLIFNKLNGKYRCEIYKFDFDLIADQNQQKQDEHFNSLFDLS